MSDVEAMTKTAEEHAREIADRAMRRWDVDADAWLVCVAEEIADALRQTERAVWRAAAEVALKEADKWLYGDGYEHMACCELAAMFRLRTGDEV